MDQLMSFFSSGREVEKEKGKGERERMEEKEKKEVTKDTFSKRNCSRIGEKRRNGSRKNTKKT